MELHKKNVNRSSVLVYNQENIDVFFNEKNGKNNIIPIDIDSDNSNLIEVEEKQTKTIILSEGKTLRLLSLELFGDKAFWVYIYQENIDIIPNPNIVSSGLNLKIPDIDKYFIKKDDSESISKAIQEGIRILDSKKRY
ncbi:MAG: hypothetical protein ITF98_06200 [Fermentimonas sp.]|nr:hypothetical protein [Fermentimonas sp.]